MVHSVISSYSPSLSKTKLILTLSRPSLNKDEIAMDWDDITKQHHLKNTQDENLLKWDSGCFVCHLLLSLRLLLDALQQCILGGKNTLLCQRGALYLLCMHKCNMYMCDDACSFVSMCVLTICWLCVTLLSCSFTGWKKSRRETGRNHYMNHFKVLQLVMQIL